MLLVNRICGRVDRGSSWVRRWWDEGSVSAIVVVGFVPSGCPAVYVGVNKRITLIGDDADVVMVHAADARDYVFEVAVSLFKVTTSWVKATSTTTASSPPRTPQSRFSSQPPAHKTLRQT